MNSRLLRLLALLFAFSLIAAACADDSDDDGTADDAPAATAADDGDDMADDDMADDSGDDMADDSDDMADDDMADDSGDDMADDSDDMVDIDRTGEVIKIGYVNNEGAAFALPEFRTGGEVAIQFINDNGGINGAMIETEVCLSDGTPESAINCANQLIEADVVLAYMGIEVASEAAINLWVEAGIPYISSHAWGVTEQNSPGSVILHSPAGAYAVGPAKTFADLGIDHIAVILEDTPAGNAFMDETSNPIMAHHGIEWEGILVDPAAPDWTAAIATAQAAGVDGVWGQLTEPGCIGMVSAAAASGYDKPVFAGSCSFFIPILGPAAIGAYTQSDVFFPSTAEFAPPEIQAQIAEYVELMTAAGYEDHIEGFAVAPYSAWRAMEIILERIEGPMTSEAVLHAFKNAGETPGWFGPNHRCGEEPWPAETSACKSEIAVWQIAERDDGTIGRVLVGDGFIDAFEFSGF
ncbi:ABC transporter substrate-binding protein [Candidatus Poriferisodalis sp.]|uniref:ABC transporter substrate-binding protein n=1 Tax=Candidatus Poriferisodalis sp. TaxID=3101277 RepID=UPI003B01A98A